MLNPQPNSITHHYFCCITNAHLTYVCKAGNDGDDNDGGGGGGGGGGDDDDKNNTNNNNNNNSWTSILNKQNLSHIKC